MMAEFPSNKTHTWAHIPLWPLLSIIYHFSGCPLLPGETVLGERGCRGKEERTEILGVWIGETINWKSQVVQVEGRNMRCYWERPRGRFRARQTENGISFCMALYPTLGFWNTLPIHCVPRPRSAREWDSFVFSHTCTHFCKFNSCSLPASQPWHQSLLTSTISFMVLMKMRIETNREPTYNKGHATHVKVNWSSRENNMTCEAW